MTECAYTAAIERPPEGMTEEANPEDRLAKALLASWSSANRLSPDELRALSDSLPGTPVACEVQGTGMVAPPRQRPPPYEQAQDMRLPPSGMCPPRRMRAAASSTASTSAAALACTLHRQQTVTEVDLAVFDHVQGVESTPVACEISTSRGVYA